jgi:dTDP-glucose 4,6-dehydratase
MPPDDTRLLVTGGTGFVGRSLLRWLAAPGRPRVRPTLLSRDPARFRARFPALAAGVELLAGDVRRFEAPPGGFTHVLHGATDTGAEAHAHPEVIRETILEGTRRVLEVAQAVGAGRVLLLSSGAAYGPQPAELDALPETYQGALDPADPGTSYGRAKREAEALCAAWTAPGHSASVGRLFAFVGPDLPLDAHFAIGNFLQDALAGRPIEVRGDGSPVRTYLDQDELAGWLWALLHRGAPGRVYNVGSDEAVDMAGLARLVAEVVQPGLEVRIARARADYAGRQRYVPSLARVRAELGLEVRVPLREALRRTAAWHRALGADPARLTPP